MEDRELLELAAKAAMRAGLKLECPDDLDGVYVSRCSGRNGYTWNPLEDDGDALRLANSVRLTIYHADLAVFVKHKQYSLEWLGEMVSEDGGDRNSAARRAIVRAAAEIGKAMQEKH